MALTGAVAERADAECARRRATAPSALATAGPRRPGAGGAAAHRRRRSVDHAAEAAEAGLRDLPQAPGRRPRPRRRVRPCRPVPRRTAAARAAGRGHRRPRPRRSWSAADRPGPRDSCARGRRPPPSRETIDRLRSFDSLSSTLDHAVEHLRRRAVDRFERHGGTAAAGHRERAARRRRRRRSRRAPHAATSSTAAIIARGAVRHGPEQGCDGVPHRPERYR